jgi:PAS domain S-box-containing protein
VNNIVLIAPYIDLYNLSTRLINEHNFSNVEVLLGDLEHGLSLAQNAVELGARVIISRGGTYNLIKKNINVPVVEIRLTAFDILRSFKSVYNYDSKIGVIGYKNVIYGYDVLEEMLGSNAVKFNIKEDDLVEERIKECIADGIEIFVGDSIVCRIANQLGCKSYLITSGEESIVSSIEESIRILEGLRFENEITERLRTLIDFVHDGIISVDKDERIIVFNSIAQKMFNLSKNEVIGKKIVDVVGDNYRQAIISDVPKLGEILEIEKEKVTFNSVPIIVDEEIIGTVSTFQDITYIQNLEKDLRVKLLERGFVAKYKFDDIIHESNQIKNCIEDAKKYSKYDSPILVEGPSGVGKELFVQSIHNYGSRKNRPFIAINCAAIPPTLIESELFGYVGGAFTGAKRGGKAGIFELGHSGTIFLDEISELPLSLQGRLLRVLQEKEVMRIGDDKVIPIDVRIICATNKSLKRLVSQGEFRADLFYRINILVLEIPSLDERKDDIEILCKHFIKKYSKKYSKKIKYISAQSMEYLLDYRYEGNVRELEGMIERAVILCEKDTIEIDNFIVNKEISLDNETKSIKYRIIDKNTSFIIKGDSSLRDVEDEYIKYVLSREKNNITKTAEVLEIDRSTLWRKLNKE